MPTLTQDKIKASVSAHRDRNKKKRYFRSLWLCRLNAVIRALWIYCCYSIFFFKNMYKNKFLLNRKILAQIYIFNRESLYTIFNEIIKKGGRNRRISIFFFHFFNIKINDDKDKWSSP